MMQAGTFGSTDHEPEDCARNGISRGTALPDSVFVRHTRKSSIVAGCHGDQSLQLTS